MTSRLPASAIAVSLALALCACGSATTPATSVATTASTAMADMPTASAAGTGSSAAPMVKGAYLTYADYQSTMAARQGSKVVLFFHAPWCPDCRATDAALTGSGVPDGLTVVQVDYDSMSELKQKYGITQQHTFVQVDGSGMLVKKWTGAKDAASIKAQTT